MTPVEMLSAIPPAAQGPLAVLALLVMGVGFTVAGWRTSPIFATERSGRLALGAFCLTGVALVAALAAA